MFWGRLPQPTVPTLPSTLSAMSKDPAFLQWALLPTAFMFENITQFTQPGATTFSFANVSVSTTCDNIVALIAKLGSQDIPTQLQVGGMHV